MPRHVPDLPATLPLYYQRIASHLPEGLSAYFCGAAGQGRTARANRQAFDSAVVTPRVLSDVAGGSTAVSLLGASYAHPIFVAPFAYQRALQDGGEIATAQGAGAQQANMILSAQSSCDMREVRQAGESCDWFQLYWLGSRAAMAQLIARAQAAGFTALVLTVDAPVQGVRDAEIAAGFQLPEGIHPVNIQGLPGATLLPLPDGGSQIFDQIAHVAMGWEDLRWICETADLPVLVKGILHPGDARRAVEVGAKGIIVSNHGGRVFDGAPASLSCLPKVVAAVGDEVPVLMDGGVRRGIDVFVALALGAKAVLVGHPIVAGLGIAGALGVSHVLRLLRDELEVAMLLAGCATLDDIAQTELHFTE